MVTMTVFVLVVCFLALAIRYAWQLLLGLSCVGLVALVGVAILKWSWSVVFN